jgi:hypothetical protein
VLGVQFAHRPDQAHRGLTSIDHCDSSGKPDALWVNHGPSLCVVLTPPTVRSAPLFGRGVDAPAGRLFLADLASACYSEQRRFAPQT